MINQQKLTSMDSPAHNMDIIHGDVVSMTLEISKPILSAARVKTHVRVEVTA